MDLREALLRPRGCDAIWGQEVWWLILEKKYTND
jgi:hypothetical protein